MALKHLFGWPAILVIVSTLLVTTVFNKELGNLEGRHSPVTVTHGSKYRGAGSFSTHVWFDLTKIRDCEFVRVEFHLGDADASIKVRSEYENTSELRGPGELFVGPWLAKISLGQVDSSFAVVVHDCHPLFNTRTILWEPSMEYVLR